MDGATADGEDLVGKSLRDGRYLTTSVIGRGSQGATLEAVDKREGRPVAVKRFQVRGASSWKDVELAEREAEVLLALDHPLLPRAVEHFEEQGCLYLVMERIEGEPLSARGRLGRDEAVRLLYDAARVLDYLHQRSPPVIHRDIKPGNIILRPARPEQGERRGSFVLVDFGSVRNKLEPRGGSTVVGTFGYMAPEQLQGRALPATDVYAVGVTVLRLLTGVEPESLPHRGLGIDVPAALPGLRGDPLLGVLGAMVEPDPDRRAARIGPLLVRFGLHEPVAPPVSATPGAAGRAPAGVPAPEPRRARPDPPHGPAPGPPSASAPVAAPPPGIGLPPLVGAVVLLMLSLARVAVVLTVGVAIPVALSLLSLVFGRSLYRAAAQVRRASQQADEHLKRAVARTRVGSPAASTEASASSRVGPRIDESAMPPDRPPPRSLGREIEAEIEAAAEAVEDEIKQVLGRGRRRRDRDR